MTPATEAKQLFIAFEDALQHPEQHPEELAALITSDYVMHGLPPGMSLAQYRAALNAAIPDGQIEVIHLIAEGELLAARLRVTGTHQGILWGIPPTGRPLSFEIFEIFRVYDGKMAEQWALADLTAVYKQLGVTQLPS
jgi:predicted ester cyclase